MPKKTWNYKLDHKDHSALFETGGWKNGPRLTLDEKVIDLTIQPKNGRFSMYTDFTGKDKRHEYMVRLSSNGFTNSYDLAVDGTSVTTGQALAPGAVIFGWSWVFFAACLIAAFMNVQSFLVPLIALLAGFGCLSVSSNPQRKLSTRLEIDFALTSVAWLAYLLFP